MTISINGTNITFNDSTQQTVAYNAPVDGSYSVVGLVFTSPNSYTKPDTLQYIKVTCVGAGGTGGPVLTTSGPNAEDIAISGGGGAGGLASAIIPAANLPASPITVTIGTAPGGTSSFGTFVTASGGGNAPSTTGVLSPSYPRPIATGAGGSGGSGSVGAGASSLLTIAGRSGKRGTCGNGTLSGGLNPTTVQGGTGGDSALRFGIGGRGARGTNSDGVAGSGYGAGGGGAGKWNVLTGYTGGSGTNGIVIIEEFY